MQSLRSELYKRIENVRTIVFDVGNVLLRFDPKQIYNECFLPEHADALYKALFTDAYPYNWMYFDHGLMDDRLLAETIALEAGLPGCGEEVLHAVYHFHENRVALPMSQHLQALKQDGFQLYCLSNYNANGFRNARTHFSFFQYIDGFIISGEERLWKPMPEIYQTLIDRYQINPAQTLFIDDRAENTAAAEKFGFLTWTFPTENWQ